MSGSDQHTTSEVTATSVLRLAIAVAVEHQLVFLAVLYSLLLLVLVL